MLLNCHVEGRYPGMGTKICNGNMQIAAEANAIEGVTLRFDDKRNIDFWLIISLSEHQLEAMLDLLKNK